MTKNLGNAGPSRRNFLQGLGAAAAIVTAGELLTNSAEAQEAIESQENKIPSVQEIDTMTRETLSTLRKQDKSIWVENASDELRKRIFGGSDVSAGILAYSDGTSGQDIYTLLNRRRNQATSLPTSDLVHQMVEKLDSELKNAETLKNDALQLHNTYLVESRTFFRKVDSALDLELRAQKLKEQAAKLKNIPGLNADTLQGQGEPERIDTLPASEQVREAALALARANDKLLELRTKYLRDEQR